MTLEGILCGRGWAVGKEARDQEQGALRVLPSSAWPVGMWGTSDGGQIGEGPDSHRVSTFLCGVELYTLPAAEQVELGFLIKPHLSFPALGYWCLKAAFFFLSFFL